MDGNFEKEMLVRTGHLIATVEQLDKKFDGLSARVSCLEGRRNGWVDWLIKTGFGTVIGGLIMVFINKYFR